MIAVVATEPGGPEVLTLRELPDPTPGPGEVTIDVVATAVNRADTLQRRGHYPPPPGTSELIGLECSGTVREVGDGVMGLEPGQPVCALLAGGGYASVVSAPAAQVMSAPEGIDLATAAAVPEAAATVWSNVFMEAALRPGESLLVHGGAGGLGSLAIQIAHALGHPVSTTAGSADKVALCESLGAAPAVNYREEDFAERVLDHTQGRGVDVVLDNIGGPYLERNLKVLALGGRLAIIGMQGGARAELPIGRLMQKRARIIATSLRPRPVEEKGAICAQLVEHVWPLIASGQVAPVVDSTLPLSEAAAAHERLESSQHAGKIVLTV
ncbi:NAD(P)H-quinone oxidoreductase [Dietzia aurantiaca]|uniref:NAD(P)H-quinone oxidoreductase n=1 Tax=Dietzia aurantiaca TaxID=983873 RepID=A0ABV9PRL5_9ACTN